MAEIFSVRDRRERRRLLRAVISFCLLLLVFASSGALSAQTRKLPAVTARKADASVGSTRTGRAGTTESAGELARALAATCRERKSDPQGSVPIDVMQARPSLPERHPNVLAGVGRAERLLPAAKELTSESLRELARGSGVGERALRAALQRVRRVTTITPDMELRDNASVLFSEARSIRFGTLFLVGLNSDESMISVLAHELTHVADGPRGALAPAFRGVSRLAGRAARLRLSAQRAEELACDLVGVMATRAYIEQTPSAEPLARRAARAIEHNCVEHDSTDAAHLSPRLTMRALLTLDPALAREITGEALPPPFQTIAPAARPIRRKATTTHHVPR